MKDCSSQRWWDFPWCLTADSTFYYLFSCDGKKVCEVTPAIFARDPCNDTFKYIQTTYTCIPASESRTCFKQ